MDRKGEKGRATRGHIVDAAMRLFAEAGYEGVSIEAILAASGISRGALYHHFAGKEALFAAVLEAAEARVAGTVLAAAQGAANPLDALRAGCAAWLKLAAGDAAVRRIVLVDAPSVVGWQAWREMDERHALGLLKRGLGLAAAAGRLPPERVDAYAHALLAVLTEMAMLVARSDDGGPAALDAVELVLSRFVGAEPGAPW